MKTQSHPLRPSGHRYGKRLCSSGGRTLDPLRPVHGPQLRPGRGAGPAKGIPVFFVKRLYRADGSDDGADPLPRLGRWRPGLPPRLHRSQQRPGTGGLRPQPGTTPSSSPGGAPFPDGLDLILRRLDVRTVILTGTTTPNCITPPAMTPSLWSTTPWC